MPVSRRIIGLPSAAAEMATLDIPHDCRCSWVVVQSGVGWNCRSRLKIMNALCVHVREHQEQAAAARAAAAVRDPWSAA